LDRYGALKACELILAMSYCVDPDFHVIAPKCKTINVALVQPLLLRYANNPLQSLARLSIQIQEHMEVE
jgi:hypothetical protein